MAKKKVKQVNNKKARKRAGGRGAVDPAMGSYLKLLSDPCRADFARAPYQGTSSGYVMRCKTILTPASYPHNNTYDALDAVVTFIPGRGLKCIGWGSPGATFPQDYYSVDDYVTTPQGEHLISKYRVLAACAKWVPTGPYGSRKGSVALTYSAGGLENRAGVTRITSADAALTGANFVSPNGSTPHEVRWLPSFADQDWSDVFEDGAGPESYAQNDNASITITLKGVDAYTTGGGDEKTIRANGYIEYTAVYEWIPDINGRGVPGGQGSVSSIPPQTVKPLPFTLNDALRAIGDIGSFVVPGVNAMTNMVLSGGVKSLIRAAPALLTM